jgi:DNA-binding NtrC family response regulator
MKPMSLSDTLDTSRPPTDVRDVASDRPQRISLLVYYKDSADVIPLARNAQLVVGRVPEADISIPEPTLSRQHARIERMGDDVWIEDLGSSNGTLVNGEPIDRKRLLPGDDIGLGNVALSVHINASYGQGLEHHAKFAKTLEEEIVRAKTFGRSLALLLIKESGPNLFAEWSNQLRQLLRPVDRIAIHSVGHVEILLPETDRSSALQRAQRLIDAVGGLVCGVAAFPTVGVENANALFELCKRALESATGDKPVVAAGRPTRNTSQILRSAPIIGNTMREVYRTVSRVANSRLPVLLQGETGVGKEVVAQAIHDASPRRKADLCSINCGAIPRDLVLSVLFGHERGAFTGAERRQRGLFEEGDGSTLLLDEVGELPLEAQVALLRALETGKIRRVGGAEELPVDVRVISATHRDLESMCDAGTFRRDLLFRLNPMTIEIPALRARADEIRPLAERFLVMACKMSGCAERRLSEAALDLLMRYRWPGNVRELRNAMERAVIVSTSAEIQPSDLPDRLRSANALLSGNTGAATFRASDPTPFRGMPHVGALDFKTLVRRHEADLILSALHRCGWNRTRASEQLEVPLRTLMHKIQSLGIKRPPGDTTAPLLSEGPLRPALAEFEGRLLEQSLIDADGNKAAAARQLKLPLSTFLYKLRQTNRIA